MCVFTYFNRPRNITFYNLCICDSPAKGIRITTANKDTSILQSSQNHKNKTVPFQPVVSECRSLSTIISTFIDYKLQQCTTSIHSYIHNSTSLLCKLDSVKELPSGCRLFTSNATSMYTNIDPTEGIPILHKYLDTYVHILDWG